VGKTPTVGIILRPRPKNPRKFNGTFVNILFLKPSDGNERWQQTEEEVANRKQRRSKITCEGMKHFIFPFYFQCQWPVKFESMSVSFSTSVMPVVALKMNTNKFKSIFV
jgi:hypothetical protein